jgi:SAM-dependent methyltransferase
MSEKSAIGSGRQDRNIATTIKVPFGPPWNPRFSDRPATDPDGAEKQFVRSGQTAGAVPERPGIPVDAAFLQTQEWGLVRGVVEEFKIPFRALSRQLVREVSLPALHNAEERVCLVLDKLNQGLQSVAEVFAKGDVVDLMRLYIFREIFPYFMLSRFAKRAYYKPGGYAGDYLMMEMIYRNEPDGSGRLGKLIDAWCLGTPAACAVRGRRRFLKDLLTKACGKRRENNLGTRILNLACGANRELFDFLAECTYTDRITAVGIDSDSGALEYTNRNVDTFAHDASVRLLMDNVIRWAVKSDIRPAETYDIIYTAGLTDYLGDKVSRTLIRQAFEQLSPGGTFVLGNFGHDNPNKTLMDEILDWRLVHRNARDLSRLFRGTGFGANIKIKSEENGVNLFAVATKPLG